MTKWQPIHTAPKDDTVKLFATKYGVRMGVWGNVTDVEGVKLRQWCLVEHQKEVTGENYFQCEWEDVDSPYITHWMLLPEMIK